MIYEQENLIGKRDQKCKSCGDEEFFLTANEICQRCNYNILLDKNISKEEWNKDDDSPKYPKRF